MAVGKILPKTAKLMKIQLKHPNYFFLPDCQILGLMLHTSVLQRPHIVLSSFQSDSVQ